MILRNSHIDVKEFVLELETLNISFKSHLQVKSILFECDSSIETESDQ